MVFLVMQKLEWKRYSEYISRIFFIFYKKIFSIHFQEYDTDREYVGVTTLNDYTGIQLKAESADYDEKLFLKTAKLCSAVQCGHEDNPKSKNTFMSTIQTQ